MPPRRDLARRVAVAAFSIAALASAARAQALADEAEPTLDPGPNLTADGVPPIPASLVDAVRPYTEMRTATFRSWHPTRREMLITTRFGETDQVHRVDRGGGDRRQLTFLAEPISFASHDPRDGRSFVFSSDTGGDEQFQLYRHDLDTGRDTRLTDGVKRHFAGPWSNSGDRIAFVKVDADAEGAFTEVWTIDPGRTDSGRVVAKLRGGGWTVSDWTPDDGRLLVREARSEVDTSLWLLDAANGAKRRVTPDPATAKAAWSAGRISNDGETAFVTTNLRGEFMQLAALRLADGGLEVLTPDLAWDVTAVDLSRQGTTLAFLLNEGGYGRLYLLDVATGKRRRIEGLPEGAADGLRWHDDGRTLAVTLSAARVSGDVYVVVAESGAVERWTESETGGLDASRFVEPTLIEWPTFDGRKVPGFLYQPDPTRFRGRRPVIVEIHGGPESQFRPSFRGAANYWLEELGVAVLYPNVRGSTGYGKSYLDLDNGFKREGSYDDVNALFDWIAKNPHLDAERIMVTGGSYGGHMTFAIATRWSDRIRCSVPVIGLSSLRTFLEHTQAYRRDLRRVEYGDERDAQMRAFLDSIAPINHAAKIEKPMLVVAGRNDPRAPWSESDQIVKAVRANDVPAWFLTGEDEGHGFKKKSNRSFQLYATALFVERFLVND